MENNYLLNRMTALEKSNEKLSNRITEIEKDKSLEKYQFEQIMKTLEELKEDVNELKDKPSKRWDIAITAIITSTIGLVLTLFLGR